MGSLSYSLPALGNLTQNVNTGISTAATVGTAVAIHAGAIAAGSLVVPVIGAAIAGATLLVDWLISNSGCGQTCVVSSDYANQAEAILKQNLAAWQSEPHTLTNQQAALDNYDAIWAQLVQLCGDPQLGDAGKRCVTERERNGTYPWVVYYRDPIANASDVVDDTAASGVEGIASAAGNALAGIQNSGLLLPLLLIGAALLLGDDKS